MRHRIDPTVDYAFKLLLGMEENTDLLLHFLNGVLDLPRPITEVQLINPFVPAEYAGDDLGVVDVLARDAAGTIFGVEIQRQVRALLPARMVYTLTDLFQSQLREGRNFAALRPVQTVWVLDEPLLRGEAGWLHQYQLRERRSGRLFSDHLGLNIVELSKWTRPDGPLAPGDQWVYFLKEARGWDDLPQDLSSPEMRKAMAILDQISEKTLDYFRYQARENELRQQRTDEQLMREAREETERYRKLIEEMRRAEEVVRAEREAERQAKEAERQAKEAERQAKEAERQAKEAEHEARAAAESENQALRARLRALGVDPDAP